MVFHFFVYIDCKILFKIFNFIYMKIIICYIIMVVLLCERMEAMQREKHFDNSLVVYFIFLMLLIFINLINKISFLDLLYLVVITVCFFKSFIIVNNKF